MLTVPVAARTAAWLNAWLDGRAGADAVISGVRGPAAAVDFRGLGRTGLHQPALLLGELRRLEVHRVSVALPRPGDPLGLGGPAAFNIDALDAGEAVVLHGPGLGLLPMVAGQRTTWRATGATPPAYLPDVAEADRELRHALLETADRLAALDVAAWSPAAADALLNLRTEPRLDAPMSLPDGPAARAFVSGLRGMEICRLATRDEGGSLSAYDVERRRSQLRTLDRAARVAVVAACSSVGKA